MEEYLCKVLGIKCGMVYMLSVESDRREIGLSPQEGQVRRRVDVSVVVKGWCLATKSFDEG